MASHPGLTFEPLKERLLRAAGYDPANLPKHAPIKKAMADLAGVNTNTINRWERTDRVPFHSADRVCILTLGQHPCSVWGSPAYTEGVEEG
jgi:hypothetical protein